MRSAAGDEPEPVDSECLESITDTATARHENFTLRRAAEHGIRVILNHEGTTDSATVKARIVEAFDCDERTVERAAGDLPDLVRTRGYRGSTSWSLNNDMATRTNEGTLSTAALRERVAVGIIGVRQAPLATDREVAAELLADHFLTVMGARVEFEHEHGTVSLGRPPHDHDWRSKTGRKKPHEEVWRQGPGWRIAATPPDD
jgi:hypothetical protein